MGRAVAATAATVSDIAAKDHDVITKVEQKKQEEKYYILRALSSVAHKQCGRRLKCVFLLLALTAVLSLTSPFTLNKIYLYLDACSKPILKVQFHQNKQPLIFKIRPIGVYTLAVASMTTVSGCNNHQWFVLTIVFCCAVCRFAPIGAANQLRTRG